MRLSRRKQLKGKQQETCSYWKAPRCGYKKFAEEIFIPMDSHVKKYCESKGYRNCPNFNEKNHHKPTICQ